MSLKVFFKNFKFLQVFAKKSENLMSASLTRETLLQVFKIKFKNELRTTLSYAASFNNLSTSAHCQFKTTFAIFSSHKVFFSLRFYC